MRPRPPRIVDQPSQKKSWRPWSSPENSGIHNDASATGNTTHRPEALVSCHLVTIAP